ncbi:MAG: hypothetical protein EA397_13870 [Deltaproteobacteria bacterium]|nr:MAG: hypothetical protein EA397_13870 [Deltaproteobacteria bacterium]
MSCHVTELDVPGLLPAHLERLQLAGYETAEQIADLSERDLVGTIQLETELAKALLQAARAQTEPQQAEVVALHSTPHLDDRDRGRGLKLARRLERTADLLRQARLRVEGCEANGRRKTLARIDRIFSVVQGIEHDVLALGASKAFARELRASLDETDGHLSALIDRKKALKKKHLKRLRKALPEVRRRLEALL